MVDAKSRQDRIAFDFVTAAKLSSYAYAGDPHVDFRAKVLKEVKEHTDLASCIPFECKKSAGFLASDAFDAALVIRAVAEKKTWLQRFSKNSIDMECGRVDKSVLAHATSIWKQIGKHVRDQLNQNRRVHMIGHSLGGSIALVVAVNAISDGHSVDSITTFGAPECVDSRVRSYLTKKRIRITQFYHYRDFQPNPSLVDGFVTVGDQIHFTNEERLLKNPIRKPRLGGQPKRWGISKPISKEFAMMSEYVSVAESYKMRK